jgi:hypothetical protein
MTKKAGFWIAVSFFILALASLVLYFVKKDQAEYANEMISKVGLSFKNDLKVFLSAAESSVQKLKLDAGNLDVDTLEAGQLDLYFSKLISEEQYLQGVVIFGRNMNYVIYREEGTWVTSHNTLNDTLIKWTRRDDALEETGTWFDTYNFFLAQKEMDILRIPDIGLGEHVWRTAQSTRPSNRDLFFNIFRLNKESSDDMFAFMYRTRELGTRFSKVLQFDNPLVTILTSRDDVVTPIRTDDEEKIETFKGLEKEVKTAFQTWMETSANQPFTISFTAMNTEFWVAIDSIRPLLGVRAFAVTLSDQDLVENRQKINEAYLYLAILFFIFGIAAMLPVYRKQQQRSAKRPGPQRSLTDDEILGMIKKGESEFVEFKSSLRWDLREQKVNKVLEDVILKSIAAFANAKGGSLFIGVTDDLQIIGLEHDFKTLKKQDADFFELHLRKLINNQFTISFSNEFILMRFPQFEGKTFCIIRVSPGDRPLYVKTRNKQGQEVEKFYVRSGNASQEITSLKEINEYIKSRFELSG